MHTDWQTWVALSVVAVAGMIVFRRFFFGGRSSCGSCHGCADKKTGKASELVQLSPKKNTSTQR